MKCSRRTLHTQNVTGLALFYFTLTLHWFLQPAKATSGPSSVVPDSGAVPPKGFPRGEKTLPACRLATVLLPSVQSLSKQRTFSFELWQWSPDKMSASYLPDLVSPSTCRSLPHEEHLLLVQLPRLHDSLSLVGLTSGKAATTVSLALRPPLNLRIS
jgi:hypothetical protein